MSAVALVQAVNSLLQLVVSLGISWSQLAPMIEKAQAEGRQFGAQDLEILFNQQEQALAKLRAAIEEAKAAGH